MLLKISWIFLRGAALGQHVFHLMFCPTIHVFCTDWNSFRNIVDEWGCQKFSKFFKSRRYFLHRRFGFFNFWKSSFIFITCRLLQASPSVWQCLTKFDRSQRNHWRKVWDLFAFAILKLRDRKYIPAWSGRWLLSCRPAPRGTSSRLASIAHPALWSCSWGWGRSHCHTVLLLLLLLLLKGQALCDEVPGCRWGREEVCPPSCWVRGSWNGHHWSLVLI